MLIAAKVGRGREARELRDRAATWRSLTRHIRSLQEAPHCAARRVRLLEALRDAKRLHEQWFGAERPNEAA